jgi:acyl-CoA-binding protein
LLFYGLFKQAVSGDCPSPKNEDDVSMTTSTNISGEGATLRDSATESALRAKRDAWLTFSGMRRRDAMRKFVQELDSRLPGWRL